MRETVARGKGMGRDREKGGGSDLVWEMAGWQTGIETSPRVSLILIPICIAKVTKRDWGERGLWWGWLGGINR